MAESFSRGREEDDVEMADALDNVLTEKERDADTFMLKLVEKLFSEFEKDDDNFVAEEKMQVLLDLAEERLSGMSISLEHKFGAILKKYITLCQERKASRALSRIKMPPQDLKMTAENYRHCFSAYIDSPYVTFAATSKAELGNISTKHAFVLHLWCMINCYRVKGDKMMAISISGKSSVGKSSIFESPAFENGHSYVAEAGVGRFEVKKRSTLIYSDICLDILHKSKDAGKFRTIARSEPTTCKVFAKTVTLPPLWVLITANQRIHDHLLPPDPSKFMARKKLMSHIEVSEKKKEIVEESIAALKNRVIECYCRNRPVIDSKCLPNHGSFTRIHFLLGAYSYVLGILENYKAEQFYTPMILKYLFTSLSDNFELYERVMDDGGLQRIRLVALLHRMVSNDEERLDYLKRFGGQNDAVVIVTKQEQEEEEEEGENGMEYEFKVEECVKEDESEMEQYLEKEENNEMSTFVSSADTVYFEGEMTDADDILYAEDSSDDSSSECEDEVSDVEDSGESTEWKSAEDLVEDLV